MIRPLNELTKKNIPFKWTKQCQRSLDYVMQVIATNPILVYPDPDTQYFFEAYWFSLEQKSCCSCRQAFIYFSRLHQV